MKHATTLVRPHGLLPQLSHTQTLNNFGAMILTKIHNLKDRDLRGTCWGQSPSSNWELMSNFAARWRGVGSLSAYICQIQKTNNNNT